MRRKVVVAGEPDVLAGMRQQADVVVWPSSDATGADVVVIADAGLVAGVADWVARRAPAAVLVATDAAWCDELLAKPCFPRGRVFAALDIAAAVDAVLGESGELDVTVRHDGEHGREGLHQVRARLGARGVVA